MKNTIVYKIFFACFFLFGNGNYLLGQNYTEDMKKIMGAFKNGEISFHMKYCFYPYDSLTMISDSMSAYCCMSRQDYYCKISTSGTAYEYFKNSKYYFIVDHSIPAIAVDKSTHSPHQMWDISKVDSIVHTPGVKVSYKDVGRNEGEYTLTMSGTTWNKLKLTFNKSSYILEKMFMYSSSKGKMLGTDYSKPRIGIFYSNYSYKQVDENTFTEDKFFYDTPNAIVLTDTYKKYKLLDYIHKLSKKS